MKNIKKIVNEEVHKQLLKEYSDPDLGYELDLAVAKVEDIAERIEKDNASRVQQGNPRASLRDSSISSLISNVRRLRESCNIINKKYMKNNQMIWKRN